MVGVALLIRLFLCLLPSTTGRLSLCAAKKQENAVILKPKALTKKLTTPDRDSKQ